MEGQDKNILPENQMNDQNMKEEESADAMMGDASGENKTEDAMTAASTYEPFTVERYEAARQAGQPILLYFYANWCPTCAEQEPRNQELFKNHQGGVAAFRINYNDNATDADEVAIAKQYGVVYQHTMFFLDRKGNIKKKTVGTVSDADMLTNLSLITN